MAEAAARTLSVFYGGTFDPFHRGHLAIARHARDRLRAPIRLMPAADPPHRPPPGASAEHRAAMLREAVAGEPGLLVDLRELRRDEPSYTVDTLRGIRGELGPDAPVALLVGADSLLGLPKWKDWQELPGLAHFVVARRPGVPLGPGTVGAQLDPVLADALDGRWTQATSDLLEQPAGRILPLEQPLYGDSATRVRQSLAEGGAWQALVPPPVAGYILRHGLYATGGAP